MTIEQQQERLYDLCNLPAVVRSVTSSGASLRRCLEPCLLTSVTPASLRCLGVLLPVSASTNQHCKYAIFCLHTWSSCMPSAVQLEQPQDSATQHSTVFEPYVCICPAKRLCMRSTASTPSQTWLPCVAYITNLVAMPLQTPSFSSSACQHSDPPC